jgi:hypothetical protein
LNVLEKFWLEIEDMSIGVVNWIVVNWIVVDRIVVAEMDSLCWPLIFPIVGILPGRM